MAALKGQYDPKWYTENESRFRVGFRMTMTAIVDGVTCTRDFEIIKMEDGVPTWSPSVEDHQPAQDTDTPQGVEDMSVLHIYAETIDGIIHYQVIPTTDLHYRPCFPFLARAKLG